MVMLYLVFLITDDQTDVEETIQKVMSLLEKFPSKPSHADQYVSLVHIFSEQDDHLINCFHVILNIYIMSRYVRIYCREIH